MMLPCLGLLRGTQMTTCTSGCPPARSRTVSSSLAPPRVSLATTRIVFMGCCSSSLGGRLGGRAGGRGLGLGGRRRPEDAMHGARDAVLVRAADHGRHLVE